VAIQVCNSAHRLVAISALLDHLFPSPAAPSLIPPSKVPPVRLFSAESTRVSSCTRACQGSRGPFQYNLPFI
jgi:hypothetical protein